jgi:NitT/TauT family transport system ATP-binding protein
MAILNVIELKKTYHDSKRGDVAVIDDFSLHIERGEFVSIVGKSGSGKTTLLEMLAGLQQPDSGQIFIDDKTVLGPCQDCGMVFQEYALFPWLTVQGNMEFGPRMHGINAQRRFQIVDNLIKMVGLNAFTKHYPHEISGGMKQLVAVARALANEPKILLMDEPFAAMDTQTRENLQRELLRIWHQTRETILFVTHNIEEAVYLADRVIVMTARPGKIKQEISISLPRPRHDALRMSSQFHELEDSIRSLI